MSETEPASDFRQALTDYLFAAVSEADQPTPRRWVMSSEWWVDVRRLNPTGYAPLSPDGVHLLGLPVVVREDAGAPHIEDVP